MSELSFCSVFDGVSLALHAHFPSAQVHGEAVRQGLRPGDFNVVMPAAEHIQRLGSRYQRTPTLDVIYYPKGGRAECYDMADRLAIVLDSITTPEGDVIHAADCHWTVTDEVLHVLVTYPHHVYLPQEEVKMEALTIEQKG